MMTRNRYSLFLAAMTLLVVAGLLYVSIFANIGTQAVLAIRVDDMERPIPSAGNLAVQSPIAASASRVAIALAPVTFVVTGASGYPLGGAVITLRGNGSSQVVARTNLAGEAQVSSPAVDTSFRVQHTHHAAHEGELLQGATGRVEILLEESVEIHGIVRLADGSIPAFPTVVYAWRGRMGLEHGRISRKSVMTAKVSPAGDFRVQGVQKGKVYSLEVGGKGWCSRRRVHASADQAASLELWRILGARVRVLDSRGGLIPRTNFGRYSVEGSPVDGSLAISHGSTATELAGITWVDAFRVGSELGIADQVFLFKVAHPVTRLDFVDVRYSVPGFVPKTVRVGLHPVADALAAYTAQLERTVQGHADVRYASEGLFSESVSLSIRNNSLHSLVFRPTNRELRALSVELRDWPTGSIAGVPYGEYEVLLGRSHAKTWSNIGLVEIGPKPVSLTLPFSNTGSLKFRFLRPKHARNPLRYIRIEGVGRGDRKDVKFRLSFSKAPYLIIGLSAGDYYMRFSDAFGRRSERQVTVVSGATTPITASWPTEIDLK